LIDEDPTETQRYGNVWIFGGFSDGGGLIRLSLSGGKGVFVNSFPNDEA